MLIKVKKVIEKEGELGIMRKEDTEKKFKDGEALTAEKLNSISNPSKQDQLKKKFERIKNIYSEDSVAFRNRNIVTILSFIVLLFIANFFSVINISALSSSEILTLVYIFVAWLVVVSLILRSDFISKSVPWFIIIGSTYEDDLFFSTWGIYENLLESTTNFNEKQLHRAYDNANKLIKLLDILSDNKNQKIPHFLPYMKTQQKILMLKQDIQEKVLPSLKGGKDIKEIMDFFYRLVEKFNVDKLDEFPTISMPKLDYIQEKSFIEKWELPRKIVAFIVLLIIGSILLLTSFFVANFLGDVFPDYSKDTIILVVVSVFIGVPTIISYKNILAQFQ